MSPATTSDESWMVPSALGPCACSQLRRTARKTSMLYDHALAEAGLTVTQYAVLVNIGRAGNISRTNLAQKLGMDRTTLTRNLQPLEKAKLVVTSASDDRRERLLRLSAAGRRKLDRSFQLWHKAQKTFLANIGSDMLTQLRTALHAAELAADQANRVA